MTRHDPNEILDTVETEPRRHIVKHVQQCTMLGRGSMMILGTGSLFRHVNPEKFMWNQDGERQVEVYIPFRKMFPVVPQIQMGLTGVDASKAQNLRLKLDTCDVSVQGFVAIARTWDDTRLASIDVSWFAISGADLGQKASLSSEGLMK